MIGARLIETGLLLGLYVLLAGAYGCTYGLARFRASAGTRRLAGLFYAMHVGLAAGIVIAEPLGTLWKVFLGASSVAIFFIPRITWRYLERSHADEVRT